MDCLINHTANHVLEHEAVFLTEKYLLKANWPFDRLPVVVIFGLRRGHSHSSLKIELKNKRLFGEIRIFYNYLYLIQDEGNFFRQVVPHELAHVLSKTQAYREGKDIKEHGPEWKAWLMRLSSDASPSSTAPGKYNYTPIGIFKGERLVKCDCDGDEKYSILTSRNINNLEQKECKHCKTQYSQIGRDEVPAKIQGDLDYILEEESNNVRVSING